MSKVIDSRDLNDIKRIKTISLLVSLYIVVCIISNISSLRIIMVFALSMDAGTLLYPITFTLRDIIHKKAGKQIAIFTIILAAVINLFMFVMFYIVAKLPADMSIGLQLEFGTVLIPGLRIVIGSIISMIVAEFVDTAVYSMVVKKLGDKAQWVRVLLSNGISIPLDSTIFSFVAFYGIMPLNIVVAMIISNIIVKYVVTMFSIPTIYTVKENKN